MKTFCSFTIAALAAAPVLAAQADVAPTPVKLQVGQSMTVMLNSNASTGYMWKLANPLPAGAPVEVSLFGAAPDDALCCGFPVPVSLTINAVKPGRQQVRVVYARPWEKDKAPAKELIYNVTVTK